MHASYEKYVCANTYRVQIPEHLVTYSLLLLLRHEIAFNAVYRSPSFT